MLPLVPTVLILPALMLPMAEILPVAFTFAPPMLPVALSDTVAIGPYIVALDADKLVPETIPLLSMLPVALIVPITATPVLLATSTLAVPPALIITLPLFTGIPMLLVPLASLDEPAVSMPPMTN